ncbi:MAG: radical SAM family heme chaperone HemW [Pseudomonadota bacterium]
MTKPHGFGIYVHWPFCAAKCPYCDFNSHVSAAIDHDAWERAYIEEIDRLSAETPDRIVTSVFFGGGTPSLMEPRVTSRVLDQIARRWRTSNDIEVTLEANPTSVEAARFKDFKTAGVNRVSMGIQALNNADLQKLGRLHTADEALAAFDIARARFDRVSFDLIYARQDQTLSDWEKELQRALSYAVDHLSLYQLTVEQGTAFGDRFNAGKLRGLPTDDTSADMYELTQDICAAHGMPSYEVSNHARDGAQSRHNLIYWRMQDYVGIGPGAHGRLTLDGIRYATETPRAPALWLGGHRELPRQVLRREEQADEMLMMGLRLKEGVSHDRYAELAGHRLQPEVLADLVNDGFLIQSEDRIIVTDQGFIVLNAILERLLTS